MRTALILLALAVPIQAPGSPAQPRTPTDAIHTPERGPLASDGHTGALSPIGRNTPVDYSAVAPIVALDQAARAGDTNAAAGLVRLLWPDRPDRAIAIARRESGLTCTARNRSGAAGLFQLMPVHRARAARLGLTWPDVQTSCLANLAVAVDLYHDAGWQPWTT